MTQERTNQQGRENEDTMQMHERTSEKCVVAEGTNYVGIAYAPPT